MSLGSGVQESEVKVSAGLSPLQAPGTGVSGLSPWVVDGHPLPMSSHHLSVLYVCLCV